MLTLAAAPVSRGQAGESDLYAVKIKKVKENIYLAYRPEPLRDYVEGNVTIIVNERDVVVVDAGARRPRPGTSSPRSES